jgi:hypothetical protein
MALSGDEVVDRLFWDTPWWRGSEQVRARIRFAIGQAASGVAFREELPYWVADGRERIVDFAMHPIHDRSGAVMFLRPLSRAGTGALNEFSATRRKRRSASPSQS